MAANGQRGTLALFVLCLVLCDGSVVSASSFGPTVSSVEVVSYKKFTPENTSDLYVNLTVGVSGQDLHHNMKFRPTSKVALRGSECYKNHQMKNIDSESLIFTEVNQFYSHTS